MSRESRLLVILLAIAAVGVSGLMVVANQYRKAFAANAVSGSAPAEDPSVRALRLVDGFLAAREAVKAVVAADPVQMKELSAGATSAYRAGRANAIAAHGMTEEDYAAVRLAWRKFLAGKPCNDPALLSVFEARRSALEGASLGPLEAVDDAIK